EIYSNLQGKEANGKKVCIELFTPDEYIKNLDKFKILYISGIPDNKLNKLITSINDKAILTISDNPDFLSSGGIIQFVNIDKNIRFQINLTKAEKSKLLISSRLLRIASFVKMD
ncbi:YfiR family protein, partial [bacterium]|nr:YfiR family protein [bacterium]